MALPVNGSTHLIPAYYSIYRPRKDKRLSWPRKEDEEEEGKWEKEKTKGREGIDRTPRFQNIDSPMVVLSFSSHTPAIR